MKFLANENFPAASVEFLRRSGYDVLYVAEGFKSISDVAVMQMATAEERTILTFDRDYGELIFKHNLKPPKGVMYLRMASYQPDEPGKMIRDLLQENLSFEHMLPVYDGQTVRQRIY